MSDTEARPVNDLLVIFLATLKAHADPSSHEGKLAYLANHVSALVRNLFEPGEQDAANKGSPDWDRWVRS